MDDIEKGLLIASLKLKKYLEVYGIDRYDTKRDILVLDYLHNITNNQDLNLPEKDLVYVFGYIDTLRNSNPQLI